MDLHSFYLTSARARRLMALKALRKGDPSAAHKHLKVSRQEKRAASLYEPGKVSDIRSGRAKKKKKR